MNKWIAEFDLEDGDTMPEHMDLHYMGAYIDFHCRPLWIPMTERFPEVKQRVIVQYADGSMAIKRCIDAGHLQWFYARAVAWMPLPPRYKGESHE